jgi:hypothetical protein
MLLYAFPELTRERLIGYFSRRARDSGLRSPKELLSVSKEALVMSSIQIPIGLFYLGNQESGYNADS